MKLDRDALDLSGADFERGSGTVTLAGNLKLNYVPVRLVVQIDLQTLAGTGRLIPRAE